MFRTVDGGKTWSHIAQTDPTGSSPATQLPALGGFGSGLTYLDSSTGWAAGHAPSGQAAYFYVTHDGSSSWQRQSLPTGPYHTVGGPSGGIALQPPTFFNDRDGVMFASGLSLPEAPQASLNALYITHDGVQAGNSLLRYLDTSPTQIPWTPTTPG